MARLKPVKKRKTAKRAEKKREPTARKSDRPSDRARIETFVQQFFRKGALLTEEILQESRVI